MRTSRSLVRLTVSFIVDTREIPRATLALDKAVGGAVREVDPFALWDVSKQGPAEAFAAAFPESVPATLEDTGMAARVLANAVDVVALETLRAAAEDFRKALDADGGPRPERQYVRAAGERLRDALLPFIADVEDIGDERRRDSDGGIARTVEEVLGGGS